MHVEKYCKTAVGHMLGHYSRSSVNLGNEDIDKLKSCLNYNLAPSRGMREIEYYKKRLAQVKCQNRKDVKTLCDWVITLPKQNFTKEQEQLFFKTAYDFMLKRYGEDNVISAWVHKDEAGQPHMHYCFIPVCIDKKKHIEKVSAKEILTRSDLKIIHREMAAHMEQAYGYDIGILNGATIGGNRSVAELKLENVQTELKKAKQSVEALEAVKGQSVLVIAQTIKKRPQVLAEITRAVRIAMGEEPPTPPVERSRERSR